MLSVFARVEAVAEGAVQSVPDYLCMDVCVCASSGVIMP